MQDATLAILAGGRGTRMGRPKASLRIDDRPILAHLLKRLRWDGATLLVTAPGVEHPPGCEGFDVEAIDPVADQGPLRGVLTALESSTTPTVVVCTVDMPAIEPTQLRWLIEQLAERPGALAVMTCRATSSGEMIEPFPSIFRIGAAAVLRGRLEAGELAVQSLREQDEFLVLPAPSDWPDAVWTNLNTPADVDAFTPRSFRAGR